jgi:hypothetical protein
MARRRFDLLAAACAALLALLALPAGAAAIVVDHDDATAVETTPGGDVSGRSSSARTA